MAPIRQAGIVAFRRAHAEPLFLVVTSRLKPSSWIFPKGHIEPGETEISAALRELREECGVTGRVIRRIGTLAFCSGMEFVDVQYFLVEATNDGTEQEGRLLRWLPLSDAQRLLSFDDARALLTEAAKKLGP
jgi:8-oxo-dGTP diphosphatase